MVLPPLVHSTPFHSSAQPPLYTPLRVTRGLKNANGRSVLNRQDVVFILNGHEAFLGQFRSEHTVFFRPCVALLRSEPAAHRRAEQSGLDLYVQYSAVRVVCPFFRLFFLR